MSTLTKILIILLTISSIFLCGIVVTYVANAEDYKKTCSNLKTERDRLKANVKSLTEKNTEQDNAKRRLEDKLNKEIAGLRNKSLELDNQITELEREKTALEAKVSGWVAVTADFTKTNSTLSEMFEGTSAELKKVKSEQIQDRKKLDELTSYLEQRIAIIEDLQAESKRLLEQKTALEEKLNKYLQEFGRVAAKATPVTQALTKVIPVEVEGTEQIALKAIVTDVDLTNKMAEVSIGSADGVKDGMKFYVTRGDQFICEIIILDVDIEKAIGFLDVVSQEPKIGDNAVTNF